jgi:hypothetical protein
VSRAASVPPARADYSALDQALDELARSGPDLRNGLSNHAPMAVEALCALGRADAVRPWLEGYRSGLEPRPPARERIAPGDWPRALGRIERTADWMAFAAEELEGAPWREVLSRWTARLAPGLCASATHGVIRVGHAARALAVAESPPRRRELADALGVWAANYQTLPTLPTAAGGARPGGRARDALARVRVVPPEARRFRGTIVSSLEALGEFPAFAPVIDWFDAGEEPGAAISDLTETFARAYLANARDLLGAIVFVHGVTSAASLRSIVPFLDAPAARAALRFAWQAGAALYAAFGARPAPEGEIEAPREDRETLVDLAIENGDEHAIKFTEACLREHEIAPSPVYLAAARHAIDALAPG